jgi:phage gp36-like protein
MTTPVASGTLYATVGDLRNALSGTDSGTGTAAQLTDAQLTLALYAASNRVSVYAGNLYDSSTVQADPPGILHDLTLDLACFWADATYLKHKAVETTSPIYIKYQNALSILQDVRDGKILLTPVPAPGTGSAPFIFNRMPPIFTGNDSNTRISPVTGILEADVPFGQWAPMGDDSLTTGGPIYQG